MRGGPAPPRSAALQWAALSAAAAALPLHAQTATVVQPAELPLGVLTALIGVPVFLLMLRHFWSSV